MPKDPVKLFFPHQTASSQSMFQGKNSLFFQQPVFTTKRSGSETKIFTKLK